MQGAANEQLATDLGCIGLVLASSSLALAPLVLVIARRLFPGRSVVLRRWGFSNVVAVVVCIAAVLALLARLFPVPEGSNALVPGLGRMACALGAGCALAISFARHLEPEGARALGFPSGRPTCCSCPGSWA
jgi:hypothetical protein